MSVFRGEMAEPSDPHRLPAVVTVEEGSIRLETGPTELGEWKLSQVVLDERDGAVLLQVEGDELILFLEDRPRFLAETAPFRMLTERRRSQALSAPRRVRRFRRGEEAEIQAPAPPERRPAKRAPRTQEQRVRPSRTRPEPAEAAARVDTRPVEPAAPVAPKPVAATPTRVPALVRVGRLLRRRWPIWAGPLLFGLGVAFAPGLVIMLFLLAGILVLAFGGLALSDTGLAVKIPSPFTPTRLILIGAALAAVGVLIDLLR